MPVPNPKSTKVFQNKVKAILDGCFNELVRDCDTETQSLLLLELIDSISHDLHNEFADELGDA